MGFVVVAGPGVLQHRRTVDVVGRRAAFFGADRRTTQEVPPGVADARPGFALIECFSVDAPGLAHRQGETSRIGQHAPHEVVAISIVDCEAPSEARHCGSPFSANQRHATRDGTVPGSQRADVGPGGGEGARLGAAIPNDGMAAGSTIAASKACHQRGRARRESSPRPRRRAASRRRASSSD